MPSTSAAEFVHDVYARLGATYGREIWHWDSEHVRGPMDIIAGAILVQHTTWQNAERALEGLRALTGLDPARIAALDDAQLMAAVRVGGTPTVKARRLRALVAAILDAGGDGTFLTLSPDDLRARLLATHGVGPETADAIALYAAGLAVFVIDAYTRRIFGRLGITPEGNGYEDWRAFFECALAGAPVEVYQRYHAWLVLHAKSLCRPRPNCPACPLLEICAFGSTRGTPEVHEELRT